MLDGIIKMVAEKTGLNEMMAKVAVDTVIGQLKDQLPAPIAGALNGVIGGGESAKKDDGFGLDDAAGMLGGLFGK